MSNNQKKKHAGGRPRKWTKEASMSLADELLAWLKKSDDNLFFERFLYEVKDLYPQLIGELQKYYPEFDATIKKARKIQEQKIADLAMKHKLNVAMAIFFLKHNCKWSDKGEPEVAKVEATDLNLKFPGLDDDKPLETQPDEPETES